MDFTIATRPAILLASARATAVVSFVNLEVFDHSTTTDLSDSNFSSESSVDMASTILLVVSLDGFSTDVAIQGSLTYILAIQESLHS